MNESRDLDSYKIVFLNGLVAVHIRVVDPIRVERGCVPSTNCGGFSSMCLAHAPGS